LIPNSSIRSLSGCSRHPSAFWLPIVCSRSFDGVCCVLPWLYRLMGCRVDSPRNNMKVVPFNISVLSPNQTRMSYNCVLMEIWGVCERTGHFQSQGRYLGNRNRCLIILEWMSFLDNRCEIWNSRTEHMTGAAYLLVSEAK
jgi:hypothetical protein